MRNLKTTLTKLLLSTMAVTTLLATSAGASAATKSVSTPAPAVAQPTIALNQAAQPEIKPQTIKLHKRVTTSQISNQVQTVVDASALNLNQQHHDSQLK